MEQVGPFQQAVTSMYRWKMLFMKKKRKEEEREGVALPVRRIFIPLQPNPHTDETVVL